MECLRGEESFGKRNRSTISFAPQKLSNAFANMFSIIPRKQD